MKKNILLFISCLFIYSCSDDFYPSEFNINDEGSVTFQDKVLDNGQPVKGAIVSIYGNGERYFDSTNSQGQYSIDVPANALLKTGFMSLSIFHPDYKSLNVTYEAPLQSNSTYDSKNIANKIVKCGDCLEITKARYSELYHLGDNNFGGLINSQFQKESDGTEVSFDFQNSSSRAKLKITFEAKGLQPTKFDNPGAILFGTQTVALEMSPEDGSYGQYSIEFENDANIETIKFITSNPKPSNGDVDDWEFTSFYIEGTK